MDYQRLLSKFFDAMSPTDKKTWDEVASKARKDLYDQTLRMRLIRYMIENPNDWERVLRHLLTHNKLSLILIFALCLPSKPYIYRC